MTVTGCKKCDAERKCNVTTIYPYTQALANRASDL